MKAIQITVDEELLEAVDATEEARTEGRSAVFRKATADYLRRKRQLEIAEAYAKAYGSGGGIGEEFAGWEKEGQWPKD